MKTKYFKTFKEARIFMDKIGDKMQDYGQKTINGQILYYVLYI